MKKDYDVRDADYRVVHQEKQEEIKIFIDLMEIKPGDKVLDIGGGFGTTLQYLLKYAPTQEFEYTVLDYSQKQLDKAREFHSNINFDKKHYLLGDATEVDLQENYDVVISKMFIHELPINLKGKAVEVFKNALGDGGRLVIWKPYLTDDSANLFREVIKSKDQLADWNSLAETRYFLTENELFDLFEKADFPGLELAATISYDMYSKNRLTQEFQNNPTRLKAWNDKIMSLYAYKNENDTTKLEKVEEDNLLVKFKRGLYKLTK